MVFTFFIILIYLYTRFASIICGNVLSILAIFVFLIEIFLVVIFKKNAMHYINL